MITPSHPGSEKTRHAMPAHLLHNLRTELSPIIGCAELLMEQAREQGQEAFVADVQIIHAAGRRLEAFINDNFFGVHMPETPVASATQEAAASSMSLLVLPPKNLNPSKLSRECESTVL